MTGPVCDDITDGVIELLKRVGLSTGVPLALVLLTGCTAGDDPPEVVATSGSAAVPAATGELPEAEAPGGNLAGVGAGGDWDAIILECEDPGQEAVVQHVVNADVTGDGVADAVVARTCDVLSSYFPSTVEVFDGASPAQRPWRVGKPLLSDAARVTERPWVTGIEVRAGEIVINAHSTGVNGRSGTPETADDNICPKTKVTYRYRLRGTEFETAGVAGTTGTRCLPTG